MKRNEERKEEESRLSMEENKKRMRKGTPKLKWKNKQMKGGRRKGCRQGIVEKMKKKENRTHQKKVQKKKKWKREALKARGKVKNNGGLGDVSVREKKEK
jgi:hypothetical protein